MKHRKWLWILAATLCIVCAAANGRSQHSKQGNDPATHTSGDSSPQSFYIAIQAVSDASPFWFDYVFDVSTGNDTARITLIRVAPVNDCRNRITASATETTIPAESVNRLTKGLCSIHRQQVEHAIAEAKPSSVQSVFDSASFSIVERCGDREEIIRLPLPETIDVKKMRRAHPEIANLWHLASNLFDVAFHGNPLASDYSEPDIESQRAAEPFIAKLRSGAFDKGFSKSDASAAQQPWSTVFNYYYGVLAAPPRVNGDAQDKDALGLDHYVSAVYPPLARLAQISGDVRLTFHVDPSTGIVDDVSVLEGHRMLAPAAVEAVQQWRFKLPLGDPPPTTATIRFDLSCSAP
jgi:TonB family protein